MWIAFLFSFVCFFHFFLQKEKKRRGKLKHNNNNNDDNNNIKSWSGVFVIFCEIGFVCDGNMCVFFELLITNFFKKIILENHNQQTKTHTTHSKYQHKKKNHKNKRDKRKTWPNYNNKKTNQKFFDFFIIIEIRSNLNFQCESKQTFSRLLQNEIESNT